MIFLLMFMINEKLYKIILYIYQIIIEMLRKYHIFYFFIKENMYIKKLYLCRIIVIHFSQISLYFKELRKIWYSPL